MTATPTPAFADRVHDAQSVFRTALCAMAQPGTVHRLTAPARVPAPFGRACVALALALTDDTTPVWLDDHHATGADHLRFHCACPLVTTPSRAAFGIARADNCPAPTDWSQGTRIEPQRAATVIMEIASLARGDRLILSGPGIDGTQSLACAGMPQDWIRHRGAVCEEFPCGIDVFLTAGDRVAAIPRTTCIEA